ncbi:MAG TPA: Tfp pilus assembly protein FimT/FimU [Steroidobacteraceae bacterium]|nr:Tfp pilus assembly protein FimT/FimU [Steroidobacteraceae bacterium]
MAALKESTLNRMSGYTMMEMLIVMAIVAILVTVGLPSFRYVTNSNRIAGEINGLLGDMQFARGEAIKEGRPVTVCTSSNGTSCAGVTTWQSGWIVFSDVNGNGAVDAGEVVLRVQTPFSGSDTFVATNTVSGVTFNRLGYANGIANGTLVALHDATNTSNWTRCLSINLVGNMTSMVYGVTANGVTCN